MFSEADPSVFIGIAALIAAYAGAARFFGHRPTRRQIFCFGLLVATLFIAMVPIHAWAHRRSFVMHMLEHSMLNWVVPPLFLLAVPDWMIRPVVTHPVVRPLASFLTRPFIAFLTFSVVYAAAHDPPILELQCTSEPFHAFVHVLFMVTGVILWWPLLSPLPEMPRLSYALQVMYIFLLMIPMTAVAAPIALAHTVVFPWYRATPHPFGFAPIEDQVVGGILMWVADSIYLIGVFTVIFFRWSRREDLETPPLSAYGGPGRVRVLRPHHHRAGP